MNLFGKKKAAPAGPAPGSMTTPLESIKMLRENMLVLEKREEHISKKIELAIQEAKAKSAKKDRNGALFALKRKKMYEAEITKLQGARITLDSQIIALEGAAVSIQTFQAMSGGASAMKALRGNLDADKVDEIMDDIQEEKEVHDQISDAISRPGQEMFDDEDLLQELAELDALDATELEGDSVGAGVSVQSMPDAPQTVFNLPAVPSSAVNVSSTPTETEDERALRELQASMMA